jgi:spore coat protein U-like protein
MANTPTFRYSRYIAAIAAMTLSLLTCAQASAVGAQSRLFVSVTVVDACNLNFNPLIQFQQLNRLRDATKALNCEGQRPTVQASNLQGPSQTSVDSTQRGMYNVIVDENAGQMTLSF